MAHSFSFYSRMISWSQDHEMLGANWLKEGMSVLDYEGGGHHLLSSPCKHL